MEVSARPCELPLAFDAFSQTYQALPRQEGRFVLDRRWFECCVAPAEPCHLAVWKVKACPLKGSDVFFVSPPPSAHRQELLCHKGGNFGRQHNGGDTSFSPHTPKAQSREMGRRSAERLRHRKRRTHFKNCPKSSQMFSQPGHLHTP